MKVLHVNAFDAVAGADRAARRLCAGLRAAGVDARLLVHLRYAADSGAELLGAADPATRLLRKLKMVLGTLPVRRYPLRPVNNFTPALLPDSLPRQVARLAPDLVHLHWLGAGCCRIETLGRLQRPLVWTLHDSWPFTGGCHVPGECRRYLQHCGACPVLGSCRDEDLSRQVWRRKERAWRNLDLTLVAPSRWLADCARQSALFKERRIEVIPNGLDTARFAPGERTAARRRLGLPLDVPLLLFGAVNPLTDHNKGWSLLRAALDGVVRELPGARLAIFGEVPAAEQVAAPLPLHLLGQLDDEQLINAYAAADVVVVPSRREAFGQVAGEALACGTPVAAFAGSGLDDVVEHRRCGYLAPSHDPDELARGLLWIFADSGRRATLGERGREKALVEFALERVTQRYLLLYREILGL